ncbi:MAG: ACP S-malonyltransferase [Planctomycetota bacterium]
MTSENESVNNAGPVLLCPGQGAQAVGMGSAWAETSPIARELFDRADDVLGDQLGRPLSKLCADGPAEILNKTDAAQPALFVAGAASLAALADELGALGCAAGLSLGEYTALYAAGAVGFEDGLRLVALRGRAMQDAAESEPSGMVALIGADEAQARELCEKAANGRVLVPANFNAPGQIVVSGHGDACERAVTIAGEMGLRATPLAVAGAFHSPLMQPAADRLSEALASTEIKTPQCPVLSNVTGKPHENDADSIRTRLTEQLTNPVRWAECGRWIAEHASGAALHELAPGKTLAGLMRRVDRSLKVVSHDAPASAGA